MLRWNVESGRLVGTLQGHSALVHVTSNPDRPLRASGGQERATRLWDMSSSACCAH